MRIIEKNVGPKIPYEVNGRKITFDDDLTLNLSKRQEDWPVHIDVCYDEDKSLVVGAAAGRTYVAELDIPAREYIYPEGGENGDEGGDTPQPEPVPLNMDDVTLSLWAIE